MTLTLRNYSRSESRKRKGKNKDMFTKTPQGGGRPGHQPSGEGGHHKKDQGRNGFTRVSHEKTNSQDQKEERCREKGNSEKVLLNRTGGEKKSPRKKKIQVKGGTCGKKKLGPHRQRENQINADPQSDEKGTDSWAMGKNRRKAAGVVLGGGEIMWGSRVLKAGVPPGKKENKNLKTIERRPIKKLLPLTRRRQKV